MSSRKASSNSTTTPLGNSIINTIISSAAQDILHGSIYQFLLLWGVDIEIYTRDISSYVHSQKIDVLKHFCKKASENSSYENVSKMEFYTNALRHISKKYLSELVLSHNTLRMNETTFTVFKEKLDAYMSTAHIDNVKKFLVCNEDKLTERSLYLKFINIIMHDTSLSEFFTFH